MTYGMFYLTVSFVYLCSGLYARRQHKGYTKDLVLFATYFTGALAALIGSTLIS